MKFTYIFIAILSMSLSNCGGSNTNNSNFTSNPPFKIQEIYFQKWVAGVRGGGSGTNVYITFSEVSEGVVFQELFFKNKKSKLNVTSKNQVVANFKSTQNFGVIMDGDPTKEAVNTPPEKIPFQLEKSEAVISYSKNGKVNYYKVSNIKEKEMVAYPQSNPKIEN